MSSLTCTSRLSSAFVAIGTPFSTRTSTLQGERTYLCMPERPKLVT